MLGRIVKRDYSPDSPRRCLSCFVTSCAALRIESTAPRAVSARLAVAALGVLGKVFIFFALGFERCTTTANTWKVGMFLVLRR
jgi:hypothetical protein